MVRLFVPVPAEAPAELTLGEERRHYLVHVLRLQEGDALEVFDGTGRAFDARVLAHQKAEVEAAYRAHGLVAEPGAQVGDWVRLDFHREG